MLFVSLIKDFNRNTKEKITTVFLSLVSYAFKFSYFNKPSLFVSFKKQKIKSLFVSFKKQKIRKRFAAKVVPKTTARIFSWFYKEGILNLG